MSRSFFLGPDHIDYAQRVTARPFSVESGGASAVPPPDRRMLRIDGIGVYAKPSEVNTVGGSRPALESVLVGMAASRAPIAYQIEGSRGGVRLSLGTWLRSEVGGDPQEVLTGLLRGAYPTVDAVAGEPPVPVRWPRSGLVLGVPGVATSPTRPPGPADLEAPVQRVIRAMTGLSWCLLVLAEPVDQAAVRDLRTQVLEDMRLAAAAEVTSGAPSPLRDYYGKLMDSRLASLTEAKSLGYWRTAVYLLGDEVGYPALAAVVPSILANEQVTPEPLRVHDGEPAARWAAQWAMPAAPEAPGEGTFRHPYTCQSMMSSRELAALVHLPDDEVPGFDVREQPRFDVVPPVPEASGGLRLGTVVNGTTATETPYLLTPRSLTRHALVAGTTGSGKTNTVLALLFALAEQGIPFLVLEPAKSEYRALLAHPRFGRDVQVFTPGTETVSPFRLNPFEVGPGESVSGHLDLLRAAFGASFGMWTPLPQVLEQCLHEVYTDAGWDLATDSNSRLDARAESGVDRILAFPTLSDLLAKVPDVVRRAGYDERVESDIRAALATRLRSLCVGAKGAMLDTARSMPIDVLLERPTVLELEWLGDDDDKALLMGLLLVRIAEFRRARGESGGLVHVTVIEEAHRLLSATGPRASEEMADPRGRAVETFVHLLAEIRAYGEGIVVADQVPVRLAPEVLKNTNLKVAHRTISDEDRAALAGGMAMNPAQARALTSLRAGQAAVFSGGDDTPLLVDVVDVKDQLAADRPDDLHTAQNMSRHAGPWLFQRPFCEETCAADLAACRAVQELCADEYLQRGFARTALSMVASPASLDRMWSDLLDPLRARRPPTIEWDGLLRSYLAHASDLYARRRGAQSGWDFSATAELSGYLRAALTARSTGVDDPALRRDFVDQMTRLHIRDHDPFPRCGAICTSGPPQCLYRHAVADLASTVAYRSVWQEADASDTDAEAPTREASWQVCQDAAYELIEFPEIDLPEDDLESVGAAASRVALCFAQQMFASDERKTPRTAARVMDLILEGADDG